MHTIPNRYRKTPRGREETFFNRLPKELAALNTEQARKAYMRISSSSDERINAISQSEKGVLSFPVESLLVRGAYTAVPEGGNNRLKSIGVSSHFIFQNERDGTFQIASHERVDERVFPEEVKNLRVDSIAKLGAVIHQKSETGPERDFDIRVKYYFLLALTEGADESVIPSLLEWGNLYRR